MSDNNHEYARQIKTINDDVQQLRADIGELREWIRDDVTDTAKRFADDARKAVSTKINTAREAGRHSIDGVSAEVSLHPLASLVIAAGVGMAVGALAARR